jgi:hypothetical protein
MSIEDLKEIRGHYDETSNDPIAKICDFLIEKEAKAIVNFNEEIDETEQ